MAAANLNGPTIRKVAHSDANDAEIRKNFNYSKFSSLVDRVLGDGDENALKTLERFWARWREKYGFNSAGSPFATMGAISKASSSPMQTAGLSARRISLQKYRSKFTSNAVSHNNGRKRLHLPNIPRKLTMTSLSHH
ncbi:hypothetical protein Salat_0498600 [Sesamum alatum]|uniref:Uncharacterized protein n=1 Tax=Sesamum alatum TaxID=300844 RepID=A0AAE1Z4E5_9LAMI|nr:hypothetical protein Salat_0498600 [Sesamum alatum]